MPKNLNPSFQVESLILRFLGHNKNAQWEVKPVRTPVAIFRSLGVYIYGLASRHWLISYSPIHLT